MSLLSAPYLMLLGGRDLQSMGIPAFISEVSLRLPTSPYWLFVSLVLIISLYYPLLGGLSFGHWCRVKSVSIGDSKALTRSRLTTNL
jgi:hypothetical protein